MFFRPINEHLALKLFSTRDAEEVYPIIDRERERLRVYLPWVDLTHCVEDERNGLKATSQYDPDRQISCWLTLDGAIIGACGLPIINAGAKWAEVGYWISSDYEGHGYITAAVRELERMCFTELGMERVVITNDAANTRSRAVPERLGYTLEGVLRRDLLSGQGRIVDHSVYGLLKSEWEAREAS